MVVLMIGLLPWNQVSNFEYTENFDDHAISEGQFLLRKEKRKRESRFEGSRSTVWPCTLLFLGLSRADAWFGGVQLIADQPDCDGARHVNVQPPRRVLASPSCRLPCPCALPWPRPDRGCGCWLAEASTAAVAAAASPLLVRSSCVSAFAIVHQRSSLVLAPQALGVAAGSPCYDS